MKAMTKQQLAACAGVTVKTLMGWCKPHEQQLQRLGMTPTARVLPPSAVKYIAETFCIDTE